MKKKYFFFDIDGTLAVGRPGKQYIPASAKAALKKLEEQGHFICIATGRSQAMAYDYMQQLGFKNMVSDGGNGLTINNRLLGIKPLDYDKCAALIEECTSKNIPWGFSPENSKIRLAPDESFFNATHDIYMETRVVKNLNIKDYPQIFKVNVACFPGEEEKIEALKSLPWCRGHKEYLFVEPADKAAGIKAMVDYLGGDFGDVVVFGDGKNDLNMFKPEWTSIAMGNAIDEVKQKASYITANAEDDGIYKACRRFSWIN
ncbi:MAG: Cof-type HAD-IIB family hydrolase [Clostridiales bacterium]|nr:Cof-type HAD-IIB family hydrolase [Clostridiales bacterium]